VLRLDAHRRLAAVDLDPVDGLPEGSHQGLELVGELQRIERQRRGRPARRGAA
jgi:hypothetical protein